MKVFSVSKACNACGECVLQTPLLTEDSHGFAIPVPDGYIKEADVEGAERIVSLCPVQALSIVEKSSVTFAGKAGLEELAQKLEQRLSAVVIPDVSRKDIKYNEKDYQVSHGRVSGEGEPVYSSRHQAQSAGEQQFEAVFWNRRKDFVASILTQYKSRVLRKYYDLRDPENTFYAAVGEQMALILKETMAEANALAGTELPFPEDFPLFQPEQEDSYFKKVLREQFDIYIVTNDYIDRLCEGMEKEYLHRKHDYEERIGVVEDVEIIGTDWLGNNKIRTKYKFLNVNNVGKDFVKDLIFCVGYPECYGLRSLDDVYEEHLKYVLGEYRKLVSGVIAEKVATFKDVIGRCQ